MLSKSKNGRGKEGGGGKYKCQVREKKKARLHHDKYLGRGGRLVGVTENEKSGGISGRAKGGSHAKRER